MLLELDDIAKTYRAYGQDVRALSGVSLEVDRGECVVIQGPSGSGKSTLMLVAGALLRPDRGRVRIDGADPYALSPEARARFRAATLGFVFQQFHLVPYLSVLENVLAPSAAAAVPNAERRALELLEQVGMAHRLSHVPAELSAGERQRTALARAMLARPKLLLADEPTGNLDRENAAAVLAHLGEFARQGSAVLVVSHDAEAAALAQRLWRLEAGQATFDDARRAYEPRPA